MKKFSSPTGDIYLGNLGDGLKGVIQSFTDSSIFLIADQNTNTFCVPLLADITSTDHCIILPSGEASKSLENCQHIWSTLLERGADRSSLLLNVGGGMICDLGGFAASCYQRGIRFAHIPTSLLAMADASIGGKTGVNFQGFKNYIGHFEIPSFIWIDPVFLATLPRNEMEDGLAEMIKHAILSGGPLWEIFSKQKSVSEMDWPVILEMNIQVKQRIVEADPHEKGIRKTLNFGHTIGHALESHFLDAGHPISHGRAVTLGMLAEAKLAQLTGLLRNEDFEGIIGLIERFLGPYEVTLPPAGALEEWLKGDKKKSGGRIGFSLPEKIGVCRWDIGAEPEYVGKCLNWLAAHVRR